LNLTLLGSPGRANEEEDAVIGREYSTTAAQFLEKTTTTTS